MELGNKWDIMGTDTYSLRATHKILSLSKHSLIEIYDL